MSIGETREVGIYLNISQCIFPKMISCSFTIYKPLFIASLRYTIIAVFRTSLFPVLAKAQPCDVRYREDRSDSSSLIYTRHKLSATARLISLTHLGNYNRLTVIYVSLRAFVQRCDYTYSMRMRSPIMISLNIFENYVH